LELKGIYIINSIFICFYRYIAPELFKTGEFIGKQVDIFAMGVILFQLVSGCMPFINATSVDPFYKYIAQKKTHLFWKKHEKSTFKKNKLSKDLKSLLNGMLDSSPSSRFTLKQISKSKWTQLKACQNSDNKIQEEMKRRRFEFKMGASSLSEKTTNESIAGLLESQDEHSKVDLTSPKCSDTVLCTTLNTNNAKIKEDGVNSSSSPGDNIYSKKLLSFIRKKSLACTINKIGKYFAQQIFNISLSLNL